MNGKKPTLAQKKLMAEKQMDPKQWLVVKNLQDRLIIIKRGSRENTGLTQLIEG